jgi:hypothetical protein
MHLHKDLEVLFLKEVAFSTYSMGKKQVLQGKAAMFRHSCQN